MLKKISPELFTRNRKKLRNELAEDSLAVFFSNYQMPRNGGMYYPFRQNSDLFYLTGIDQPDTICILSTDAEYLFIKESSALHSLWEGDLLSKQRASELSGLEKVSWNTNFSDVLHRLLQQKKFVYLNTEFSVNTKGLKSKDEEFLRYFKEQYPYHTIQSIRKTMKMLRLKKEPEEVEEMKKGIQITQKAFTDIARNVKPGVSEKQLEALLRYHFMVEGSSGPAYDPIIASGKNACILHYTDNNKTCNDGELLLMDIGAEVNNYSSDITRTIPVNGKFTAQQKKYYQAVLDVMKKSIASIKPGITLSALNQKTKEWLTEKHLELDLYKESDLRNEDLSKKYFPHGVSHFMGLDVHDYGDKETVLEKGMVLSCEPGLYIPEENIGIRIEDNILVGEQPVNLSESIPKEVDELEDLMN